MGISHLTWPAAFKPFAWICIFGYNVRCKTSRFPTSSLNTSTLSTILLFSLTPKSMIQPVSVKIPSANDETDFISEGKCFGDTEEHCVTELNQRLQSTVIRNLLPWDEAGALRTLCACLLEQGIMLQFLERA